MTGLPSTLQRPTFLGIGAQKCGTTWLHKLLSHHPGVFAANPKEIDFFSYGFDRGYEWYGRFFAEGAGRSARGETSPSYFYHPAVPARVKAYDPDIRLIAILRDPVERAYSNHLHEVRKGHFTKGVRFEDGLANNPAYLEQSRYALHLGRWLEHFERRQLLVLLLEEIQADPAAAARQVYAFLGVPEPPDLAWLLTRRANEGIAFRHERLQDRLRAGGHLLRRAGLGRFLERSKQLAPMRILLSLNRRELRSEVPSMDPATRRTLADALKPDMRALAVLLDRHDFPWPTWALAHGRSDAP